MSLGVDRIYYGLESPSDGAAGVAAVWQPARGGMPFSRVPELVGGLRRDEVRAQFARYAATTASPGLRRWAEDLTRAAN
ncbi:hypothetical protein [Nonomuraea sp. NPDC049400]|uniref:hypothetical protein n=1 Tax=Nonomuraea sp. NPDC049400 TaxID=3364352 RepID=UPI0037B65A05